MKHLKLIFACLLMAVLSIGQVWGAAATTYTSNVTLSSATKDGSTAAVKAYNSTASISSTDYTAVKLGSNGNAGNFYIEVPANTTTLTLHAAAWNGKNSNTLTLSTTATGVSISPSTATTLTANSGVSGSTTTYNITPNNTNEFFTYTLTGVTSATIIKLACSERCLIWGVNAESGSSTTPSVEVAPSSLAFGSVEQNTSVAAKTFSVSGSNLTGAITISAPAGYTVSPTSITPSTGSIAATDVTVTPITSSIGTFNGDVTISGGGLSSNVTVGLTMTVTAPFNGEVLEIKNTDFASSYTSANGDHEFGCITITSNQVGNYTSSIQFQRNTGYIYNKTSLGEIAKIEITKTGNNNLVVYEGTEENPTTSSITGVAVDNITTYTFSSGKSYFRIFCNNTGASNVTPIKVYYHPASYEVTLSAGSNGSLSATVDADAIASGDDVEMCKTVTIAATPNEGYKIKSLTVTDDDDDEVEVTSNQFVMPAKAVTVAATFEATKTLSSITLSGTQRTSFWVGETFSSEGLVVTAHYDDLSSATVTPNSIITGYNMSTDGNQTVTVSYTEGTEKTATYDITVKPLPTEANPATVAEIRDLYDKFGNTSDMYVRGIIYKLQTFYTTGDDAGKYTYWITDSYDSEAEPNHTNEFEIFKGLDFSGAVFTADDDIELGQEVVVKGNLTKWNSTYEFNGTGVIVSRPKVLKSIALSGTYPTEFTQGDAFSSVGLVVTASYNYGDPVAVTPTSITGYNMAATGNQTVTVSYTEATVTKTATYGISVAAPDLCEHKATISKGEEENGTFELSVSGEQCLDELEDYKTSTVLTATPNSHYHLSEVTATVGTVGTIANNECTISDINASTTITAVFAEDDKVTFSFAKGNNAATGDVPAAIADKYAAASITLPANPFALTIDEDIYRFIGWKHSGTEVIHQPGAYTVTAADAAAHAITFTAQWEKLPIWATTYTSNVTLSTTGGTNAYAEKVVIDETQYNCLRGAKSGGAGLVKVTVSAGTTMLHFHLAAWNNTNDCEVTIQMGETTLASPTLTYDSGIASSSPYTLSGNAWGYYYSIDLSSYSLTESATISFSSASSKRFVLFGVNAEYPAAITLDPASKDFGEVKENANAQFEFTITPNAMSTGDLAASIIGTDAAKFSVGAISENKVTVTFTPGEVGGPYSASLKVESGNAEVTAALSGTGITSATPEIGIDKTEVAFGNVEQNSTPATQSVAVTLSNIDENGVDAEITGSAFTISPDNLTADGSIVITPVTTTPGVYSETLTLSATGATPKNVTVTMTVVDEWAYVYTSNVTIASNTAAQVTIGGTNYAAAKTSKGSSATITLPQGVTKIHMHIVAWKDEAQTVTISGDCFNNDKEIEIIANDGVSGSGTTYPLGASGVDYYFSLTPDNAVAANTEITIATEGQKRFVLFGVNQEGGVLPVLQSLALSGDLTNKNYEAGAAINPAGLTVMGTYTLGGVAQTPVDVTDQVEDWLYDALQAGDESVTISAKIGTVTSNSVEITGLTVTDPTPRFETNPTSYISFGSKEQGATIPARDLEVTLVNVSNASVEITGTGAAAFSVDEDALTGNATLHVSASSANVGTFAATLIISDDEGIAADKEISLSLTITAPVVEETAVSTHTKWVAAEAADIKDGAVVLITGVKDEVTYAMGIQNTNNRAAVTGTLTEGVFTPGANTMAFTLESQGDGTFALRASNGKYLYAASSGSNHLKTQDNVDVNAKWTLTATSAVAESSSNHNDLKFNKSNNPPIFSCYGSPNTQTAIQFYVPKQEEIRGSLTEGKMGTICPKQEIKNPTGASFYTLTFKEVQNEKPYKVFFDEIAEGASLEAGKPYLFIAEGDAIMGVKVGDPVADAQNYNGFTGVLTDEFKLHVEEADRFYIVYENQIRLCGEGWFSVPAERAYLDMSQMPEEPVAQAPGRRRVCLTNPAANAPTDIDAINASEKPMKLMIDGQLFIIRGEKMFDATGRLVK